MKCTLMGLQRCKKTFCKSRPGHLKCMVSLDSSACNRQKMNFSICDHTVGFPKYSHICSLFVNFLFCLMTPLDPTILVVIIFVKCAHGMLTTVNGIIATQEKSFAILMIIYESFLYKCFAQWLSSALSTQKTLLHYPMNLFSLSFTVYPILPLQCRRNYENVSSPCTNMFYASIMECPNGLD